MSIGHCRLCDQKRELVSGHVWSRFAYKKFVSNPAKGGSFIDLQGMRVSNRQIRREWFCPDCDQKKLGTAENDAADLCHELTQKPEQLHSYPDTFLRFLVSVSWRVSMYYMEKAKEQWARDILKAPNKTWKQFLRGECENTGLYSQHVFVCFDPEKGLHQMLGGEVHPSKNLIFSQIGPLFIVGFLHRRQLSLREIQVWNHSEVRPHAGSIKPIEAWRVGEEITSDFLSLLRKHMASIEESIVKCGRRGVVS